MSNVKSEKTIVCVEPKRDGISCALLYRHHTLFRALTRGDGRSGEDITPQAYAVGSIPKTLPASLPAELEVRGELVMKNSTLERLNKEAEARGGKVYTSTRNLTGGTMKLKDISLISDREIQIVPWDVLGDNEALPDSGLKRLELLAESGFPAPSGRLARDAEKLISALHETLEENKKSDIQADGVVIKVDSHKLRRQLGVGSKYTNYQICFKPQSSTAVSRLREIVWQVGRSGKLTPVGIIDPVVLAGATVTRVTLNNATWIGEMGLKLGCTVEICRSGEVIPLITRVLPESELAMGLIEIVSPLNCPECRTPLEESDEGGVGILIHRCPNKGCPGRVRDTLTFIGSREVLEIDGLGPEMATRLADIGCHDLGELYDFLQDVQNGIAKYGEASAMEFLRDDGFAVTVLKMVKSLEAAKTASWERWIKALCIPMIGATLGKQIAISLDLKSDDIANLPDKLLLLPKLELEGFGEAKLGSICEWANDPESLKMCYTLYERGVRPMPVEKPKVSAPLNGVIFCITGAFEEDRNSITKKLESLGAVAKSGVSKKINLLIVGEDAGSKLDKAKALGIRTVGLEWLQQTLSSNGLSLGAD